MLVFVHEEHEEDDVDEGERGEGERMEKRDAIELVDKERGKHDERRRIRPEPLAIQIVREEEVGDAMEEDVEPDERARALRDVEEESRDDINEPVVRVFEKFAMREREVAAHYHRMRQGERQESAHRLPKAVERLDGDARLEERGQIVLKTGALRLPPFSHAP